MWWFSVLRCALLTDIAVFRGNGDHKSGTANNICKLMQPRVHCTFLIFGGFVGDWRGGPQDDSATLCLVLAIETTECNFWCVGRACTYCCILHSEKVQTWERKINVFSIKCCFINNDFSISHEISKRVKYMLVTILTSTIRGSSDYAEKCVGRKSNQQ